MRFGRRTSASNESFVVVRIGHSGVEDQDEEQVLLVSVFGVMFDVAMRCNGDSLNREKDKSEKQQQTSLYISAL